MFECIVCMPFHIFVLDMRLLRCQGCATIRLARRGAWSAPQTKALLATKAAPQRACRCRCRRPWRLCRATPHRVPALDGLSPRSAPRPRSRRSSWRSPHAARRSSCRGGPATSTHVLPQTLEVGLRLLRSRSAARRALQSRRLQRAAARPRPAVRTQGGSRRLIRRRKSETGQQRRPSTRQRCAGPRRSGLIRLRRLLRRTHMRPPSRRACRPRRRRTRRRCARPRLNRHLSLIRRGAGRRRSQRSRRRRTRQRCARLCPNRRRSLIRRGAGSRRNPRRRRRQPPGRPRPTRRRAGSLIRRRRARCAAAQTRSA